MNNMVNMLIIQNGTGILMQSLQMPWNFWEQFEQAWCVNERDKAKRKERKENRYLMETIGMKDASYGNNPPARSRSSDQAFLHIVWVNLLSVRSHMCCAVC